MFQIGLKGAYFSFPLHPKSQKYVTCHTAQKMKFSIKDFFSKCDQIYRKLQIWSHLLKKSVMENFIFWAVPIEGSLWIRLQEC